MIEMQIKEMIKHKKKDSNTLKELIAKEKKLTN